MNELSEINADSSNHEIRSYFITQSIKAIEYMSNKAYNGRIRDEEHEKIKIQQLKLIINACNVGNRVLKDRQLDDYEKEITALKHGLLIENSEVINVSSEALSEIEALDVKLARIKEGEDV